MIKFQFKIVILLLAAVAFCVLSQQAQLTVLALSRIDPLPETRILIAEGHLAEAADYLGFFMEYDYVSTDPEAQRLYNDISTNRKSWRYQGDKFVEGLLTGTSDETIGKAAGVATDFLIIGDIRDLAVQGINLAQGEETDNVLVALASLGMISSFAHLASGAATIATGGAAAPAVAGTTAAKSGLIVIKTARKLGKLPPWLGKTIIAAAKNAKNTKSINALTDILGDVNRLGKTRGGFNLLSNATDAVSLKRMANFAETFGPRSSTLYHIGGDVVVKTAQHAEKLGKDTILLAATFGKGGLRALDKVGAVTFVKYSARASKMAYKGDIFNLLARFLLMFPGWVLYAIIALSAVVWVPWHTLSRFGNFRGPVPAANKSNT